jgi:hypothetical protein
MTDTFNRYFTRIVIDGFADGGLFVTITKSEKAVQYFAQNSLCVRDNRPADESCLEA